MRIQNSTEATASKENRILRRKKMLLIKRAVDKIFLFSGDKIFRMKYVVNYQNNMVYTSSTGTISSSSYRDHFVAWFGILWRLMI